MVTETATDPRLEQATPSAPVADPIVEPIVDNTDNDGNIDPAAIADPDTQTPEPVVKPRKTAEEVLKGRVGHLTKTLSTKDQELETFRNRLATAEALLASGAGQQQQQPLDPGSNVPVERPSALNAPQMSGPYSQEQFEAAVAARAEVQEFNRKADEMYSVGAGKYADWKDAVDTLVVSGFMNKDLIDAAMAVEDGTTVLHHLGTNLDEAERINALSPIRKAAEMAKLSNSLSAPKVLPVSSAPAPIRPVTGSPSPQVDLQRISDTDDMRAWAEARAKQGSRWAKARG